MKLTKVFLLAGFVVMSLATASAASASPFERIVTVQSAANGVGGNAKGGNLAQCPAGTQLVGGGGFFDSRNANMAINRSVPFPAANGWEVVGRNWSGAASNLFATAQCGVPKPNGGFAGTVTEVSTGSFVGNNAQDLEEVGCPAGTQLLSGGGFWENLNPSRVGFIEDDMRGNWTVIGRNWSGSGDKVFAVALCGVPGASGGFSEIFNRFGSGFEVPIAPGRLGASLGACLDSQMIGAGAAWFANGRDVEPTSGNGVAFSVIGPVPDSPSEFAAQGANMSNRSFELIAKGRCGL